MKKFFKSIIVILPIIFVCVIIAGIATIKIAYPIAYKSEISRCAERFELKQSLIFAIINEESGFDCLAKSRAGARGLMQIMPLTARWIAGEMGIENYSDELLYNPRLNIEMGCFYLRYLMDKYQNIHKVLFAYNAGEGVMNETYSQNKPLVIETVEIVETREYIKDCLKSQQIYEKLLAI